jgi:hypothetical protein
MVIFARLFFKITFESLVFRRQLLGFKLGKTGR